MQATIKPVVNNRLTIPETARHLQVDPVTIRRWIRGGYMGHKLVAKRIGRRYFVEPAALEEFLRRVEEIQA